MCMKVSWSAIYVPCVGMVLNLMVFGTVIASEPMTSSSNKDDSSAYLDVAQTNIKHFQMFPGPLQSALTTFAEQSGLELFYPSELTDGLQTKGVSGELSVEQALDELLKETSVIYELSPSGIIQLKESQSKNLTDEKQISMKESQDQKDLEQDREPVVVNAPEVVIKDIRKTGYVSLDSTTGTKTDTPLIETPQSISVVTRKEMDIRSVQTINEALRYVPGVVVDQFGFEPRGYEYLLLRGFNALTTSNFRDGLSNAASGLFNGAFITDAYSLERVDVLRGPTSVTFGRGDAGGIVNSITKRPNATPIREIELQYGNFDRKRVAADLGYANEEGTLMFRLVTSALDSDTQVRYPNTGGDRAGFKRFHIAPSVTFRPTVNTTITFMGEVLNNRSDGLGFFASAPDGSFTNVLSQDPSFTKYDTNQSSFTYQFEHHFNEIFTVRQNFRYARQKGDFNDLFTGGFDTPSQPFLLSRSAYSTRERLSQTVVDTHLEAKFDTGPVQHTMLYGVDWNSTDATLEFFEGSADGSVTPGIDLLNPVYPQNIPRPDILVEDSQQRIDQLGFYVQDQIRYDENWTLTLSGRYDRVKTTDTDLLADSKARTHDSAFTGRAGLTYLFSNGIAPYVSYSQSFLPQAGMDASGNTFDPTRGTQYEVGVKFQPANGRGLYTVALFDLTKSNVQTPDPRNPLFSVQTGEIRSRGAEVEAKVELLEGLNFIGAFTYHDVEVTKSNDGNEGNSPIQVPTTITSGWLHYSMRNLGGDWLKGLSLGGGIRYVGRVFDDEENTSRTPAFTLYDATLGYDYGPMLFTITANNIFNKKYVSSRAFGGFWLGSRRTVVGTLKYRF